MKSINITLAAVAAVALRTESSDAFTPANLISSSRGKTIHPSSHPSKNARVPSGVVMYSTPFDNAAPNDQVVQEAYAKWRIKYSKGEFDAVRYQNFKNNFTAVTMRNNMEKARAMQNGEPAPSPIALNEYGDCSADEYRTAMGQQQQQQYSGSGPRRVAASKPAGNNGLQPANAIMDTTSTTNNNNNNNRNGMGANMANASAQLRAAVQQRTSMENELAQMKKMLEEKKKQLEKATKEEQELQQRLVLREEQKRLLNERLNNGWEDERGMNNNWY